MTVCNCQAEHQVPATNPRGGLQMLLPLACWGWGRQVKHNTVKPQMEWCFTYIERGQSKISFDVGVGPSWPAGPQGGQHGATGLCTPLLCCKRRTLTLPCGAWNIESWVRACGPLTGTRKQNEGTLSEHETGKDIPHNAESPTQAVCALCLLVRKCSRPKALSYLAEQRVKRLPLDPVFPNNNHVHLETGLQGIDTPTQIELVHRTDKVH